MSLKFRLTILLSFMICLTLFGQINLKKVGQSTMNFQLVSISPKASAMGEAYYAVGRGAGSIFYNPAAVAEMDENTLDIVVNYTQWIADIKYLGGAVSWNLHNMGVVGFSMLTVDYGTINGTSLIDPSQNDQYPLGYIDNGPVSNVGAYSFGLTYAKAISNQFLIGGNVRLAGQNLGVNHYYNGTSKENNAVKLVFDMGVKYYTGYKNFRFGMAIRNFSSNIKREEISEQLPLTFTMGAAIDVMDFINPDHEKGNSLTFATDFLHSNSYSERVNLGLEYEFMGLVALRGGYQTNRDVASWSAGVGLHSSIGSNSFEVNYSYSKTDLFSDVNRLSIGFKL